MVSTEFIPLSLHCHKVVKNLEKSQDDTDREWGTLCTSWVGWKQQAAEAKEEQHGGSNGEVQEFILEPLIYITVQCGKTPLLGKHRLLPPVETRMRNQHVSKRVRHA